MDNIAEKLENINQTLEKIFKVMPEPASKINRILETVVLIVGVFGIIGILDIIIRWVIRGG